MSSAEELKDLGNKAFSAGKFLEAVEHFTEAISMDSSNHVLFSNRSAAFASLKKYREALNDAEKTVSIKPDWAKGFSRLGAALHGLGQFEEAVEAYNKGLKLEPENKACKDGAAAATKQLDDRDRSEASSIAAAFSSPEALTRLGKDPETAQYLKDPAFAKKLADIRSNPELMNVYMQQDKRIMQALLVAMGLSGKVKTAADVKSEAGASNAAAEMVVEDSDDDQAHEEINVDKTKGAAPAAAAAAAGASASAGGASASAEGAAKAAAPEAMEVEEEGDGPKVSKADKAKAAAEKELGTAAYKSRDFETALKHYNAAAALDPTDMVFQLNISAVYFEQKSYDQCIEAALKAADLGQEHKASYVTLGKAYSRASKAAAAKDDLELALKYIGKALTNDRQAEYVSTQRQMEKDLAERKRKAYLDPAKALEHKNKGNDFFKAGDFPAAVAEYSESLLRNPDDSKVFGNRAACYIKLVAFPLAIQDCETALKLEPGFIKAYVRKGNALMGMKKYSEAQSAFYKALELDSNNSEATEGLVKCRQAMYGNMSQKERAESAMKDPEVQKIMGDPVMQAILQQMTEDPRAAREHLKDPAIAANIQKLVDAGIISMGPK